MALSERLTRAQEILGHEFNNKVLLRAALTHPSAVEVSRSLPAMSALSFWAIPFWARGGPFAL